MKMRAVKNIFAQVCDTVDVLMTNVESAVPAQPFGHEVITGARHRGERAFALLKDADLGVGIESGLFDFCGVLLDVQICSIFDGSVHTIGASPGFGYPKIVLEGVKRGGRSRQYHGRAIWDRKNWQENGRNRVSIEGLNRPNSFYGALCNNGIDPEN